MAASKLTGRPVELMLKYMSYNPLFCCVLCFDRSCFSFRMVWCHAPHQLKTAGGAGLVANYLTMRHVVLGYMVPVAGAEQF